MNKIPRKIKNNPLFKDAVVIYNNLPETLPPSEILRYNKAKIENNKKTKYIYRSLSFLIPLGVFLPGGGKRSYF